MKKIITVILFFICISAYSQDDWRDTSFTSSTITDSASGWTSFTVSSHCDLEIINTGADTAFYKLQASSPATTQWGTPLPPMSSSGILEVEGGTILYLRERANPLFSFVTVKRRIKL